MTEFDAAQLPPPARRVVEICVGEERPTLEAFLDYYRDAVTRKVSGVSEADARRQLVSSATTLGGIIKHLRRVEINWFERVLAQTPDRDLPPISWDYPDAGFRLGPGENLDLVLAEYERQCERSRQLASRFSLADAVAHHELGEVSLRWIYIHMIEETARHAGHADILREQLDGAVGL